MENSCLQKSSSSPKRKMGRNMVISSPTLKPTPAGEPQWQDPPPPKVGVAKARGQSLRKLRRPGFRQEDLGLRKPGGKPCGRAAQAFVSLGLLRALTMTPTTVGMLRSKRGMRLSCAMSRPVETYATYSTPLTVHACPMNRATCINS